jgi:hypothetical protein
MTPRRRSGMQKAGTRGAGPFPRNGPRRGLPQSRMWVKAVIIDGGLHLVAIGADDSIGTMPGLTELDGARWRVMQLAGPIVGNAAAFRVLIYMLTRADAGEWSRRARIWSRRHRSEKHATPRDYRGRPSPMPAPCCAILP